MRAVVLAEGALGDPLAKTANGLVLHSVGDEIVAAIDSTKAGADAGSVVVGRPNGIPVVARLADAMDKRPERLYLGVANVGGVLPAEFRASIVAALEADMEVVNGLHARIDKDPEFAAILARGRGRVWNVRSPPEELRIADGSLRSERTPRVIVMGMDCDVGKRLTTIELVRAARRRGLDAGFIGTGQTGCMLGPDAGAAIDCIPGDFAAGEVERMVLASVARGRDIVFIPGQASIQHPAFSGVSLAILHGAVPHAAILQVIPGRRKRFLFEDKPFELGDVRQEINLIEAMGRVRVVALAFNGSESDDPAAARQELAERTGLPVVDALHGDVNELLDPILEHLSEQGFGLEVAPNVAVVPDRGRD